MVGGMLTTLLWLQDQLAAEDCTGFTDGNCVDNDCRGCTPPEVLPSDGASRFPKGYLNCDGEEHCQFDSGTPHPSFNNADDYLICKGDKACSRQLQPQQMYWNVDKMGAACCSDGSCRGATLGMATFTVGSCQKDVCCQNSCHFADTIGTARMLSCIGNNSCHSMLLATANHLDCKGNAACSNVSHIQLADPHTTGASHCVHCVGTSACQGTFFSTLSFGDEGNRAKFYMNCSGQDACGPPRNKIDMFGFNQCLEISCEANACNALEVIVHHEMKNNLCYCTGDENSCEQMNSSADCPYTSEVNPCDIDCAGISACCENGDNEPDCSRCGCNSPTTPTTTTTGTTEGTATTPGTKTTTAPTTTTTDDWVCPCDPAKKEDECVCGLNCNKTFCVPLSPGCTSCAFPLGCPCPLCFACIIPLPPSFRRRYDANRRRTTRTTTRSKTSTTSTSTAGEHGDPHIDTFDQQHYLLLKQGTFLHFRFSGSTAEIVAQHLRKTIPVDFKVYAHYSGHLSYTKALMLVDASQTSRVLEMTSEDCQWRSRSLPGGSWSSVEPFQLLSSPDADGDELTGFRMHPSQGPGPMHVEMLMKKTDPSFKTVGKLYVRCKPGKHINIKIAMVSRDDLPLVQGQVGSRHSEAGEYHKTRVLLQGMHERMRSDEEFLTTETWTDLGGSFAAATYLAVVDEEGPSAFLKVCSAEEKNEAMAVCQKYLGATSRDATFDIHLVNCVFDVCNGGGEEAAQLAAEIFQAA